MQTRSLDPPCWPSARVNIPPHRELELHDEDTAPILLDTAVAQAVACGIDAATTQMPVGDDTGQGPPCNAVLEIGHTP